MKPIKIIVLGLSVTAAIGAWYWAENIRNKQPKIITVERQNNLNTVEVLVASRDIAMGDVVSENQLRWQRWPQDGVNGQYITRQTPDGMSKLKGSIARASIVTGEPIISTKLVMGEGAGFLSAILPAGMRAVAIEISPENGAGGFILPNDRVDLILTQRVNQPGAGASSASETILRNIRVLAIDQRIQEQNGQKVAVGRTATLELSPTQAEALAVSRQMGSISLALRSLKDINPSQQMVDGEAELKAKEPERTSTTIVRFGIQQQVTGR